MDRTEIPSGNILFRWTKNAMNEKSSKHNDTTSADYLRKKVMMNKLAEMSGPDGTMSDGMFTEAMEALDRVIARQNAVKGVPVQSLDHSNVEEGVRPAKCPPRPVRKGRPRNTSLKSYEAEMAKQMKKGPACVSKKLESSTDEENPRGGKTKALGELLLSTV